jgi:hypothetical protein
LIALFACGDPGLGPDGGGAPDAGPVVQGSAASADLVINELSPQPSAGPEWVELLNRSDAPIDLTGYFLTDKADRLDHYLQLEGVLAPGELVVIEPGDAFGLGVAEEVHLLTTTGLSIDGLAYLFVGAGDDQTLARQPSGQGAFYFADPTPGETN